MKFNYPLLIPNDSSVDYEQQLKVFCNLCRLRCNFTWDHFSCNSVVIRVSIEGFKRKKNPDGSFVTNSDGTFKYDRYGVYQDMKRIPPNCDFTTGKQMFALHIMKNFFDEDFLKPLSPLQQQDVKKETNIEDE